jgi:DNA-binding CsgD family transcriptional regulator
MSRSVVVVEDDNGLREQLVKILNSVAGIRRPGACRSAEDLSPRESEVLELLASGYIYKEIGDQLGIGSEPVRTYVKNICENMHVRGRLEAVARHRVGSGGA